MRRVGAPLVLKLAETRVDWDGVRAMLEAFGASEETLQRWGPDQARDAADTLIELAGRVCYRSFEVGLNPNITRIRTESKRYFENVLQKGDGSIFEHGTVTFAFLFVSRVFTHELVRHRVGTAISQESLRYVRPTEIAAWLPPELTDAQRERLAKALGAVESLYEELEGTVEWDDLSFHRKKVLTSALRRVLPQGMATHVVWTANHRTLRWVIEMRTDPSAEVEIRTVFDRVAQILQRDHPLIYGDFVRKALEDGTGSWSPGLRSKV